jgi:hypothetical protein
VAFLKHNKMVCSYKWIISILFFFSATGCRVSKDKTNQNMQNNTAVPNLLNHNSFPETAFSWGKSENSLQLGLALAFNTIRTQQDIWWSCAIKNLEDTARIIRISDHDYGEYLYSLEVFKINEETPFYQQNVHISSSVTNGNPAANTLENKNRKYFSVTVNPKNYIEFSMATISSKLLLLPIGEYRLRTKLFKSGNNTAYLYSDFVPLYIEK